MDHPAHRPEARIEKQCGSISTTVVGGRQAGGRMYMQIGVNLVSSISSQGLGCVVSTASFAIYQ